MGVEGLLWCVCVSVVYTLWVSRMWRGDEVIGQREATRKKNWMGLGDFYCVSYDGGSGCVYDDLTDEWCGLSQVSMFRYLASSGGGRRSVDFFLLSFCCMVFFRSSKCNSSLSALGLGSGSCQCSCLLRPLSGAWVIVGNAKTCIPNQLNRLLPDRLPLPTQVLVPPAATRAVQRSAAAPCRARQPSWFNRRCPAVENQPRR